jgi:hypothetical protein
VTVGQEVQIISTAAAEAGVARVDLSVNGQVVRADAPPSGNPTTFSVSQPWTPAAEGDVTISVVAYDTKGAVSEPATVALHVGTGAADSGGATPVPEATQTPVPDVTGEGGCTLNASYVADVTVPDDTEFAPGAAFVKTWRIRNSGTCDWTAGFNLVFVSGDQMGGQATVAVPPTAAGSTTDLSVNLTAPGSPGTYRGNWRPQSDEGLAFGSQVYVRIVVPEPTPVPTEEPTPEPTEEPTPEPTAEPTEEPVEVDIVASEDAYWWPGNLACMTCPDFGGGTELELLNGVSGDPPYQILYQGKIAIRFDLSGIPEGATIEEATLHLYLASADGTGSASISVRRATSPWSEGDHGVKPICETSGGASRNVGSGSGWYDWGVTDMVQQQHANPTTNYGFCLRGGDPDQERTFRSREGAAVTRPYLRVVYQP